MLLFSNIGAILPRKMGACQGVSHKYNENK